MAALQHPYVDTFEAYFKRADLDQDGRINGSEAVAFFKGSNLPQPVLAQIWKYSDQNNNGFLGRPEFYNALRLVTVAQSGRELTPDIVKAALFSSASAKIPVPKISFVHSPATSMSPSVTVRAQFGSVLPAPTHIGVANPIGQTSVPRGILPGFSVNQPVISPSNSHPARPPSTTPYPVQSVSQTPTGATIFSGLSQISSTSSKPTDWYGMSSGISVSGTLQGPVQGITSSTKQDGFRLTSVAGTTTGLAIKSPMLSVEANSTSSSVLDAKDSKSLVVSGNGFSSDFTFGGDAFSATPQAKQDGISNASTYSTGTHNSLGIISTTAAFLNSKIGTLDSSQNTFMRPLGSNQPLGSTVQKNSIDPIQNSSAEISNSTSQPQPSWPRISQTDIQRYTKVFVEVDKDRDGKISGEQARNLFLSWKLSREVLKQVWDLADQDSDGMLSLREFCIAIYMMERYREGHPLPASLPKVLSLDETLLQATGQPLAPYGDPTWRPGLGSSQGIPGPSPPVPITGIRPPMQSNVTYQVDGASLPSQQKLMASFPRNMENQQNENHTLEEITNAQKKPKEVENKILDSKEKVEYYRTKMQELVLYKSRCDNKLFEITERASSDKLEVESLAKKYEEKYKQVSEVASKLTMEEAAFRDMQGRKLELQNALVHMEKGGSSDGLLQVRADRIQSDLEELVKILQERCKHHGLDVKSKTTIELPFGWQPGIQQGAIDWDEDWDKFEDEGFSVAKDHLSVEVGSNPESLVWEDKPSTDRIPPVSPDSVVDDRIHENDSAVFDAQSDGYGSAKSPSGSPGKYPFEVHHYDDMHDIPGDKFTGDEPSWGEAFDGHDDIDSVWNKGGGIEEDKKSPFFDSVPSTPHQLSEGTEERSFFDDFGHLDSPKRESHARFDSVSEGYSFDDSDPFGVGLFKPSKDGGDHSPAAKDFSF